MAHMEERYRKMKQENKQKCFSDYITDVPKILANNKKAITYDRLQFLGSVSNFMISAIVSILSSHYRNQESKEPEQMQIYQVENCNNRFISNLRVLRVHLANATK